MGRDGKEMVAGPVVVVALTEMEGIPDRRIVTEGGAGVAGGTVETDGVGGGAEVGTAAAGVIHGHGVGDEMIGEEVGTAEREGMMSEERRRRKENSRAGGAEWMRTMKS